MDDLVYHEFLVKGDSICNCKEKVTFFLKKNNLARPIHFDFLEKRIMRADDNSFEERLNTATKENLSILNNFIKDLKKEGIVNIEDLAKVPQGYLSKTFHTIAHFLDGFFGVDAYFFNLIEDSYFVSDGLMRKIAMEKTLYYIISVEATYKMKIDTGFEKKGSFVINP